LVQAHDDTYIVSDSGAVTVFRPQGVFEYKPHIIDVAVKGESIYAVGYPGLFVSHDSGTTWKTFTISDNQTLRSVALLKNHLYLSGVRGQIYSVSIADVQ